MRRIWVAASGLLLAWALAIAPAAAADEGEKITVSPQLKKGDKFTLLVEQTRQQTGGGREIDASAAKLLDVEVLQADEEGYVISVTQRKLRIDGAEGKAVAADPLAKAVAEMWVGVPVQVKFDKDLTLTGLANFDAVVRTMNESMEKTLQLMGQTPERAEMIRATFKQMSGSEGLVAQAMGREIGIYLSFSADFSAAATTTEVEMPAPLSSKPLPAKVTLRLMSMDKEASVAVVSMETVWESEALTAVLGNMADEMDRRSGREPPAERKLPPVDLRDRSQATIDLKTQLPREMTMERRMTTGPGKRVDGYKIRRLEAGADFPASEEKGQAPAEPK